MGAAALSAALKGQGQQPQPAGSDADSDAEDDEFDAELRARAARAAAGGGAGGSGRGGAAGGGNAYMYVRGGGDGEGSEDEVGPEEDAALAAFMAPDADSYRCAAARACTVAVVPAGPRLCPRGRACAAARGSGSPTTGCSGALCCVPCACATAPRHQTPQPPTCRAPFSPCRQVSLADLIASKLREKQREQGLEQAM